MKNVALKKAGKLMAEARMILEADELSGDGNKGQDGEKPGNDIAVKGGDIEGDPSGTGNQGDTGDSIDVATAVAQKVAAGMDSATDLVKKIVGESMKRAFEGVLGKDRKQMVSEYNRMNLKEMSKFATSLEKVAESIAAKIDFKEVVYNALGEALKR